MHTAADAVEGLQLAGRAARCGSASSVAGFPASLYFHTVSQAAAAANAMEGTCLPGVLRAAAVPAVMQSLQPI
jgi:hypothetical protein